MYIPRIRASGARHADIDVDPLWSPAWTQRSASRVNTVFLIIVDKTQDAHTISRNTSLRGVSILRGVVADA
jgi:hypothetical protein